MDPSSSSSDVGEDDAMLGHSQGPYRPSLAAHDRQRRHAAQGAFLKVMMVLCIVSVMSLSGLTFFFFSQEQHHDSQPLQDPHHDESNNAPASSSIHSPSPTSPSESDDAYPHVQLSPADQLDLKTNFVISDKPATREYVFNITRELAAPDGFEKSIILVNGQSPGPLIEANSGDVIRVVVNNMMPNQSTTIHWHGIDQKQSVWMDGVHGVTQCGIPPGEAFVYEFNVTGQRGTFWYHSHVSVQYTDGLYGPLIIHDPEEKVPPMDDDKIIMIGDLYHTEAEQLIADYLGPSPAWSPGNPGVEPPVDNIIINGQHLSNCSSDGKPSDSGQSHHHMTEHPELPAVTLANCTLGSLYSTHVKSSQSVRLRLISHSTFVPYWFTVDNHILQIVEIDGVEVLPILTTRVFMNPGQRYSVLLTTDQTPGKYLMRARAATSCFHMVGAGNTSEMENIGGQASGMLLYDGFDADSEAVGEAWDIHSESNDGVSEEPWPSSCHDLPFDLPKPMRRADAYDVGDMNHHYFKYRMDEDGDVYRTFVNESIYGPLKDDATLWNVMGLNTSVFEGQKVSSMSTLGDQQQTLVSLDTTKAAQIVINSEEMMIHPWHLHGQNFQVVGWGSGSYGESPTTWNLENPMRRDTITIPGYSHIVVRILADNPGVWAFHCHILWHAEGGMFVMLVQQLDKLQQMLNSPKTFKQDEHIVGKFCPARLI